MLLDVSQHVGALVLQAADVVHDEEFCTIEVFVCAVLLTQLQVLLADPI